MLSNSTLILIYILKRANAGNLKYKENLLELLEGEKNKGMTKGKKWNKKQSHVCQVHNSVVDQV